MAHQRSDPRINAGVSLVLTIRGESHFCTTRDLSRGGIFVVTQAQVPVGTAVLTDLVYRDLHVGCTAQVVSIRDDGLGLKFTGLDDTIRRTIETLLVAVAAPSSGRGAEIDEAQVNIWVQWAWAQDLSTATSWDTLPSRTEPMVSVSRKGAAITCEHRPAVDEQVVLRFAYPTEVTCLARVVRFTDTGFAVEFVQPTELFLAVIDTIMTSAGGSQT